MSRTDQIAGEGKWVISLKDVAIGDEITYYDYQIAAKVKAQVVGFPGPSAENLILYRNIHDNNIGVINLFNTVVYKLEEESLVSEEGCCCGAKFTSNPAHHLSYCPQKAL